jgi:hypothetical protein
MSKGMFKVHSTNTGKPLYMRLSCAELQIIKSPHVFH